MVQRELVLHFQPKVDLISGETTAVEALLRWDHPTRGLIPPADFIPIVERSELIKPMTLYVVDAALQQCRS
jgi:EAL domain-containing protein (putative c-di-GMP-specific phosphodiesterase class I)